MAEQLKRISLHTDLILSLTQGPLRSEMLWQAAEKVQVQYAPPS